MWGPFRVDFIGISGPRLGVFKAAARRLAGWLAGWAASPPPGKRTFQRRGGLVSPRVYQKQARAKNRAENSKKTNKGGAPRPLFKGKQGRPRRSAPRATKKTTRARGPKGHPTGPAQRPFSRIWGPFRVVFCRNFLPRAAPVAFGGGGGLCRHLHRGTGGGRGPGQTKKKRNKILPGPAKPGLT